MDLPMLSAKDVIINTGKDCFFPNGSSSFGSSDEMEFSISNYQKQEVLNDVDMTLERYVEQFELDRIFLYLLSRTEDRSKSHSSLILSSGSDSELEKPVFARCTTTHASESNVTTQDLDKRRQFIALHNEEYLRSLEVDREKQGKKRQKLSEEVEIVENLNLSPSPFPKHFVLSNYNHDLMPDESIDAIGPNGSIVLSDYMSPLCKDVNFKGFGNRNDDLNSIADNFVPDANFAYPMEGVPTYLMADDIR